jgi:hypothetical protein
MADVLGVEFTSPTGTAIRVEWDADALGAPPRPAEPPSWHLAGELDWDEVEALRVLTVALPDGRRIALAAVRPAGSPGHGSDAVGAVLVADAGAEQLADALISTEYGPDELPRRLGLELYLADDALPLRVAADVSEARVEPEGELSRVSAALTVRFDGERSTGRFDILAPA